VPMHLWPDLTAIPVSQAKVGWNWIAKGGIGWVYPFD